MSLSLTVVLSAVALLAGCVAVACFCAYRQQREAHLAAVEMARANAECWSLREQHLTDLYKVLSFKTGGVGKRISECREITEALFTHVPDVFEQEKGLIYWLHATDQFFTALDATMLPNDVREHCANSYSAEIYSQVYRAIGKMEPHQ